MRHLVAAFSYFTTNLAKKRNLIFMVSLNTTIQLTCGVAGSSEAESRPGCSCSCCCPKTTKRTCEKKQMANEKKRRWKKERREIDEC